MNAATRDCPGCETFAEPNEDVLALALEALEGWLEVALDDGEVPPQPSHRPRVPKGAKLAGVPVPTKLACALRVRWARHRDRVCGAEDILALLSA